MCARIVYVSLNQIGNTPLHNAIREKHVEVVEILASIADLNCGGDVSNYSYIEL